MATHEDVLTAANPLPPNAEPARALVIDDDEFVCSVVAGQLRSAGLADVLAVSNGDEAVRLLNDSRPFKLIVSDLSMPRFDGVQILRLIAARQSQAAVLFMSSAGAKLLSSVEDLARTRGVHVVGALPKPLKNEDLCRIVGELDGRRNSRAGKTAATAVTPAELRAALKNEEITVHVQPQLDARSGALHGVEALARWNSPTHGWVPPASFIELAERSDLINELTESMLTKSLAACGAWLRGGLRTRISVNMPISSMSSLVLPDAIAALAAHRGIEADQLTLEITESGMMRDAVRSLDVLTRLRLRGIGLAIDDFGCGYSSLQQLRRLPFNELKIDCSFVMGMLDDREARGIVKSSLELCRELGLRSVAEGVETAGHWDALAKMGCDVVQGYHVASPFPAADLPSWWEKHAAAFRR